MTGLYLHIPFCTSKCLYCSFTSYVKPELHRRYVTALKAEMSLAAKMYGTKNPVKTIFLGGGTPTSIGVDLLCEIIEHAFSLFVVEQGAEVSVEANPGTVDSKYLKMLHKAGVNRLSFGVQSFNDSELDRIGRTHKAQDAINAVKIAQDAGFENMSVDLMYGLPTQTMYSWRESLTTALGLDVQHLSLYQLTVEEETPYARLVESGAVALPEEDILLGMDEVTQELCWEFGFKQYEISNFCRDNLNCRHNINYWLNDDYLAAGVAAVSYIDGVREKRVTNVEQYVAMIEAQKSVIETREQLKVEESFRETVIMGLRMVEGISRRRLQERYGFDVVDHYGDTLTRLHEQGFVELTPTHLCIAAKGWPLSNQIMAQLV